MELSIYNTAKEIRENIHELNSKMRKIEGIRPRKDDLEFNEIRQEAYSRLANLIQVLEDEFNKL